jgi:mRNA degradation ribonuclease J1/J2
VVDAVTATVREAIESALKEGNRDDESLTKAAQRAAGRLLGQKYRRQPVLLVAIVVL